MVKPSKIIIRLKTTCKKNKSSGIYKHAKGDNYLMLITGKDWMVTKFPILSYGLY